MALDGVTIGSSSSSGGGALAGVQIGAPAAPAATAAPKSTALPSVTFPGSTTLDTSKSTIASNLSPTTTPAIQPAKPADTSNLFSSFMKTNNFTLPSSSLSSTTPEVTKEQFENQDNTVGGIIRNTVAGLPAASKQVSEAINNTVIQKPADLLANTDFIKQASAGIDEGSVSGNFGQEMLKKLSLGMNVITGLTGGGYQTPQGLAQGAADSKAKASSAAVDPALAERISTQQAALTALEQKIETQKGKTDLTDQKSVDAYNALVSQYQTQSDALQKDIDTYNGTVDTAKSDASAADATHGDLLDRGLTLLTQGLGMAVGVSSLGKVITGIAGAPAAIEGLSTLAGKLPLVGKYIAPLVAPLVENAAGFAAYGQLDPNLAGNLKARGVAFLSAIGTAPLYTALGMVKNPAFSLPASFGLGFSMAKLSGASNQDAVASGLAFSFLDAAGRADGSRGLTPDEVVAAQRKEAATTLSKYGVKVTANSSAEDIKAAYYKAAHVAHPDVGGSSEEFTKVQSAYDILSKGAVSSAKAGTTPAEQSVKALSGDVQKGIEVHGAEATKQALMTNVGVDHETANRIVNANQNASLADVNDVHDKVLGNVLGSRSDEEITSQSTKFAEDNLPSLTDKYIEKFGNQVGADEAKELVPGYSQDRSTSDLVQKAAAKISDAAYTKLLDNNQEKGNNTVLITAGGTGSGKSTALRSSGADVKKYPVIYDTNLSNGPSGIARIKNALSKGYKVEIKFVYAPVQEAYKRVVGRTEQMTRESGSGRPVSAQGHIDMHHGSYDALAAVLKEFKGNPNVKIDVYDNTGKQPVKVEDPLAFIQKTSDNKQDETKLNRELNTQRKATFNEGGISERTNKAFERAETLRPPKRLVPQRPQESSKVKAGAEAESVLNRPNFQSGKLDVGAIIKDADAQIQDFVEKTMKPIAVSENLSDSFYQLEGAAQADLEEVNKIVEHLDITPADDEALYAHAENPSLPLTPHQTELQKQIDEPFKKLNAELYARIKDLGTPLEDEGYIGRFVKEKPSVMQRIFNPSPGRTPTSGQGSVLSKSAPSLKKRTMKALVDSEGNRTVVSIKDGEVTAFRNKEAQDLGSLKAKITPKQKEFYDNNVMPALDKLAADLGITHIRATGTEKGLGGKRAGVSFQGQNLVKTRAGTPERVLIHELGHQIDHRYDLQKLFSKDDDRNYGKDPTKPELRALADLRWNGDGGDATKNFKRYVRNGAEKMAVMFEAYLHVPDQFKEVAPNIFEKFEEFLKSHAEFRPILDLKPSLVLGGRTIGGEHIAGKNGDTFIDKSGQKYSIDDATTAEIEANTDLEYHHSMVASRLMQYVKLRQIDRANQFLESWKASADFAQIAVKNDQIPPDGWKMTSQINFRNYYFEARTAEILDDMQAKMATGAYNDAFNGINRLLADSIFFNGLAHPINVAVTWATNRGVSGVVYPPAVAAGIKAFARAVTALYTKNDDYLELLRNGAHLMSSDVTSKKVAENMFEKLGDALDEKPDLRDKLIKILGYAGEQANFRTNIIYKLSHNMAWLSNDLLTMQSIFEAMDSRGLSMPDAIRETAKFIPDYRNQSRIGDKFLSAAGKLVGQQAAGGSTSRVVAKVLYNRNIDMFASYHIGLMQSLTNMVKDTIKGQDWTFSAESMKQRARGADKLAMLALIGMVVYPWLDRLAQEATGSANTYVTRSGVEKYPYMFYKYLTGQENTTTFAQGLITPAVGTQAMLEMFFNRDFFTGNNIYGEGGEGAGGFLAGKIAPVQQATNIAQGKTTPGNFAATLLGVHTPKNTQLALDLNTMIYTTKPQIETQMKAHISAGDTVGAQMIGHDFNVRLAAQIKAADIAGGNSGDAARVAYFLNQYGVKMPGTVAMQNYNAKQGQNVVQKTLPNGQPVIKQNTPVPATGVIGAIETYAKAIGTDPISAFKDIFSGQTIRSVTNGQIIVTRMPLAASQADRAKDAAAQGLATPKGMNLDHIVPLEGGGDNSEDNLQLIPQAQWEANTPIENFLAAQLSAGNMTGAQVREAAIRFKAGQGETLTPALMNEYESKYGGKPLTAEDVYNYANTLAK